VTPSTDRAGQASYCRAERAGQVSWYRWLPAIVFVLFVGGFWAAAFYIKHIPVADRFDDVEVEFGLWVALIGALGGFALAACLCFVAWLVGLVRLFHRVHAATVITWIVSVLVVDAILFATLFFSGESAAASVGKTLTRQTRPVVIGLGLCRRRGSLPCWQCALSRQVSRTGSSRERAGCDCSFASAGSFGPSSRHSAHFSPFSSSPPACAVAHWTR
jgi:hypothetical protein